jgi:hypothetical protein
MEMTAERWIKQLEMAEKVKHQLWAKENAKTADQEVIRQDAEKRAWLRELERKDSDGSPTLPADERGKNGL